MSYLIHRPSYDQGNSLPGRILAPSSPLLLASGSPRRRELLQSVGIPLDVRACAVDESVLDGEVPDDYLLRIVASKVEVARSLVEPVHPALLAGDTVVVVDGAILGKPADARDARAMIVSIAGRAHEVKTRFHVEIVPRSKSIATTVTTRVFVRSLPPDWIDAYVATGEGLDKAGAYAVQGRFAFAVERIEGSYTNVVGLPLCEVVDALDRLGLVPRIPA